MLSHVLFYDAYRSIFMERRTEAESIVEEGIGIDHSLGLSDPRGGRKNLIHDGGVLEVFLQDSLATDINPGLCLGHLSIEMDEDSQELTI